MQTLPTAVTLTQMNVNASNDQTLFLIGTTVTVTVQLYKYTNGSLAVMTGASCSFQLTGPVLTGTTANCQSSGFTAAYAAGDAGFLGVSATATGLSLQNTVDLDLSIGVSP